MVKIDDTRFVVQKPDFIREPTVMPILKDGRKIGSVEIELPEPYEIVVHQIKVDVTGTLSKTLLAEILDAIEKFAIKHGASKVRIISRERDRAMYKASGFTFNEASQTFDKIIHKEINMRILDVRGKSLSQIDRLERQYPAQFYRQISNLHTIRESTEADVKAFQRCAERDGAVAMFIQEYGQYAYVPVARRSSLPQTTYDPIIVKGKEFWHKVNATQKAIMQSFRASRVLEVHSDGDLTFEAEHRHYVLTTDGSLFVGVPRYDSDKTGKLPQTTAIEDDLLKYYEVPPEAY